MIGPKLYRLPGKIFGSGLFKKTVKLSLISVSANFLGFLVPVLVAYKFGISKDTDQ